MEACRRARVHVGASSHSRKLSRSALGGNGVQEGASMRVSPDVPLLAVSRSRETDELAALRVAHWRDRDENRALVDTVVAYRRAASALAEENLELRHELARTRALSTRRTTRA